MKKHIFVILLLFAMPVLVLPVTEEGITISKLRMKPLPFNDRRDPVTDSPYNAFDGDVKSSALYSDFTMEFTKPVLIDQLKIMNGSASDKEMFKKYNRFRDIEITLYTVPVKPDKKAPEKKKSPAKKPEINKEKNKEKTAEKKNENKTEPVKDNSKQEKTAKDKPEQNKSEKNKPEKQIVPKEIENINKEKKEEKKEEKNKDKSKEDKNEKINLPEKVVNSHLPGTSGEYIEGDVKLYFTASEQILPEPKEKITEQKSSVKEENKSKQSEEKKSVKASEKKESKIPVKKEAAKKNKKADSKKDAKKTAAEKKKNKTKQTTAKTKSEKNKNIPERKKSISKKDEKVSGKNIIEIIDSRKNNQEKKEETKPAVNNVEELLKQDNPEIKKDDSITEKKETPDTGNPERIEPDKPLERALIPDIKILKGKKRPEKVSIKSRNKKKSEAEKKPVKKDGDKTRIEITESKNKSEKEKKLSDDKKPAEKNKIADGKKITAESKKNTAKEKDQKKENLKVIGKDNKKKDTGKILQEDVKVKKMTGIVKVENDTEGRVLVYAALKDTMDFQNIDLKGEYAVTKINFRTRDDEYYQGTESDRSAVTEIAFFNKGKRIPVLGIDSLKKLYTERFSKTLKDSLSGETFIMNEDGDTTLRVLFRKDGRVEFFDRYKCRKKGDPECTSLSMPDMWKVTDGKLLMRYHTLWRVWKYELDSESDMLDEKNEQVESPRWMKIYFKSDNGFSDKYLELERSEKGIWAD